MTPSQKKQLENTLVIALGGNALIGDGEIGTVKEHIKNLRVPMQQIAKLSQDYNIIVTHGNGPQVGFLLEQQAALTDPKIPAMPMDVLVAETQGQIGYFIETVMEEEFNKMGILKDKFFLTIMSYVQVDPNDPAFLAPPTKPVGPYLDTEKVASFVEKNSLEYKTIYSGLEGVVVKTSKGYYREIRQDKWRKVVPSPLPQKIYQFGEIKKTIKNQSDCIIITCGGGGIPVMQNEECDHKAIYGIEAVIDKDLATARLATDIDADTLIIATNVDKVSLNFGKSNQVDLDNLSISDAKKYLEEGHFGVGSMLTKVQAAINFIEAGGKKAVITSAGKILDAVNGGAGTQIIRAKELVSI